MEVAVLGGFADVLACSDPRRVAVCPEHQRISDEQAAAYRRAYREAMLQRRRDGQWERPHEIRTRLEAGQARTVPPVLKPRKSEPRPRVVVVECKRTRSDLLSDLRARKLLKYEDSATHCYLACTGPAFGTDGDPLPMLLGLGLPTSWGVLRVAPTLREVQALRPARKLQPVTPALVYGAAWSLATSLSHRALSGAV